MIEILEERKKKKKEIGGKGYPKTLKI